MTPIGPHANRIQERVHQDTDTEIEGAPEEEGIEPSEAKERLDEDPEEQLNATDPRNEDAPPPDPGQHS